MEEIDFVITWVDGNDPEWQKEKSKYSGIEDGDCRIKRYRDWNLLKYWFRGVEKFAPWVNKIHFVTWGHLPPWLNTKNDRIHVVNHKDFIPGQYLPTFSCRPIELNLHRIPGLSENFVYFNDDMFLLKSVSKSDFFKNGHPCDTAVLQAVSMPGKDNDGNIIKPEDYYTANFYNIPPINRNFQKKKSITRNFTKWFTLVYGKFNFMNMMLFPWEEFTGFVGFHVPYSYNKNTFEEVWEKEEFLMDRACMHKFRDNSDVSSRLFTYWQYAKGDFSPRSYKLGKYLPICNTEEKNMKICDAIENQKYKFICINDEYTGNEFEKVQDQLITSFEKIFSNKSSFEK